MRAPNIDRLCHNLAVYPRGSLLNCTDVETLYEHFVNTVLTILAESVPCKNGPFPQPPLTVNDALHACSNDKNNS